MYGVSPTVYLQAGRTYLADASLVEDLDRALRITTQIGHYAAAFVSMTRSRTYDRHLPPPHCSERLARLIC